MKPVLIRFEPETLARLQTLSDAIGLSIAEIVRTAVQARLPEYERKAGINGTTVKV